MGLFDLFKKQDDSSNKSTTQNTSSEITLKAKTEKRMVELKKKANFAVSMKGISGQKARVALALDVSGSMETLYRDGVVQQVVERALALAIQFDDNGAIDIFLFDSNAHELGELQEQNIHGYVDKEIMTKHNIWGGTNYSPVMRTIMKKYADVGPGKGDPAYVIFITDGENSDRVTAEKTIVDAAKMGIFWQFIGIGNEQFDFLSKLDTLQGRFIDNANFFQVNDISKIDDTELYNRLLNEFPGWLKESKDKGLY